MADCASRSTPKRRKIRKGTFSCWECKNRKTRCHLEPGSTAACRFCISRGLACISQEYPNPSDRHTQPEARRHVPNDAYRQGIEQKGLERGSKYSDDQSGVMGEFERGFLARLGSPSVRSPLPLPFEFIVGSLNHYLHSIIPDAETARLIMTRGKFFSLPVHDKRKALLELTSPDRRVGRAGQIPELPTPSAHPLRFARELLQLALCLQQLDESATEQIERQLKESVHDLARRFVELASRYVTSQDSLVQSQDGLGTLMLEACYHLNIGNLRPAWLVFRRALSIVQLLGLSQQSSKRGSFERSAWFRLLYADRFLSLFLGLPSTTLEDDLTTEVPSTEETELEKLERIHVRVLGRIIARNIRLQRRGRQGSNGDYDEYKETQDIDYSMKQAIKSLPSAWWNCSALTNGATESGTTDQVSCLLGQLHHYSYLAMLHLPYVLYNTLSRPPTIQGTGNKSQLDYSYSQVAALSASREALSRFLSLRSTHQTLSYRALDDKAYLVANIVILSHINGHRLGRENVLDHQRPLDLKLLNDVILCILNASRLGKDVLSSKMIRTLKRLMEVEEECAEGQHFDIWLEEGELTDLSHDLTPGAERLGMRIPYFGIMCFARQVPTSPRPIQLIPAAATAPGIHELIDSQYRVPSSQIPQQMVESNILQYPARSNESHHSISFDIPPTSQNPSGIGHDCLPLDEGRLETIWPLEDGGTIALDEWIDYEKEQFYVGSNDADMPNL